MISVFRVMVLISDVYAKYKHCSADLLKCEAGLYVCGGFVVIKVLLSVNYLFDYICCVGGECVANNLCLQVIKLKVFNRLIKYLMSEATVT